MRQSEVIKFKFCLQFKHSDGPASSWKTVQDDDGTSEFHKVPT